MKRLIGEFFESCFVDFLAVAQKAFKACNVARIEAGNFFKHCSMVAAGAEDTAVVEANFIKWVNPAKIDVV